jgi:hypothetical protein
VFIVNVITGVGLEVSVTEVLGDVDGDAVCVDNGVGVTC